MGKKDINAILQRNVAIMAGHTPKEDSMMPATGAPLPSVEEVKRIVQLVKVIIFTDYFHKRQADERMRSYIIGVNMEELYELLRRQIACGLQFCTECGCDAQEQAETLALRFIDELPEIKRLLYTDVVAMFDNDPAAQTYGEVIFSYPVVNTMTHYRIAYHWQSRNTLPGCDAGCQELQVRRERQHAQRAPPPDYRGPCNHLFECLDTGTHHHRPPLHHRW